MINSLLDSHAGAGSEGGRLGTREETRASRKNYIFHKTALVVYSVFCISSEHQVTYPYLCPLFLSSRTATQAISQLIMIIITNHIYIFS